MTERGWLTPETIPTTTMCRTLLIPDDIALIAAVSGALLDLTHSYNWEQHGAQTPEDTASAMYTMLKNYWSSVCNPLMKLDAFQHLVNQNVAGGGIIANTDTVIPFNSAEPANAGNVTVNNITFEFSVGAGIYLIDMSHVIRAASAANFMCWWRFATGAALTDEREGIHYTAPTNVQLGLHFRGLLRTASKQDMSFLARSSVTRATDAFGVAANVTSHKECYGHVTFLRISDYS